MYVPHGSQIMDMDILCTVFKLLHCRDSACRGQLTLHQYSFRDGLQSYMMLKCQRCHLVAAEFPTSLPIGMSPVDAVNDPQMFHRKKSEVNFRALLAVNSTSASWADFRLTCYLLGVQNTWKSMQKKSLSMLVESASQVSQRSMSLAASNIHASPSSKPSNIPDCRTCAVSFDATWHRRGHYSNQGFAAAIEIDSGKILDYILYERLCNKCHRWTDELKIDKPEEYNEFWAKHSSECPANFSGTSQSMESEAALAIWGRSVEKHNLAYTTYIGDGDSSSYKCLYESDPYNSVELVRKEECIGHAQKRLKNHLKKDSTVLTSKPIKITKVERIGNLYARIIVQNRGKTPVEIQTALYGLLIT